MIGKHQTKTRHKGNNCSICPYVFKPSALFARRLSDALFPASSRFEAAFLMETARRAQNLL